VTQAEIDRVVQLFNERVAHWVSEGFHGPALYTQLASDAVLPPNFQPRVVAAILNVDPPAVAARRKRGAPPSFIRTAANAVLYPRDSFCFFLGDRFVERRPALARREYTRVPAAWPPGAIADCAPTPTGAPPKPPQPKRGLEQPPWSRVPERN
jgi:hypothetical protein